MLESLNEVAWAVGAIVLVAAALYVVGIVGAWVAMQFGWVENTDQSEP